MRESCARCLRIRLFYVSMRDYCFAYILFYAKEHKADHDGASARTPSAITLVQLLAIVEANDAEVAVCYNLAIFFYFIVCAGDESV